MSKNLFVIAGPSGVGKGSLIKKLISTDLNYTLSVSATTRPARAGEVHGTDYFFMTKQEFDKCILENGFLEWAEFAGNKYGTLISEVDSQLALGKKVILEIELAGVRQVKKLRSEAKFIFIAPPSLEILQQRLAGRGTENPAEIADRILIAKDELAAQGEFDFVLINDDLAGSFERLLNFCELD